MAGKVNDAVKNIMSTIGAAQTLVENFPMNLISFDGLKFSGTLDLITILFKVLGIDRDEIIQKITKLLQGAKDKAQEVAEDAQDNIQDSSDGSGFLAQLEEIVKIALELNIINILNCTTNPIISDNLLDVYYKESDDKIERSGSGITLSVSEIDFTGALNKNPFDTIGNGSKFYFDTDNYNANTVYKSKDFNAFLWYIINKSDKSQSDELIWDDRYRAKIYGKKKKGKNGDKQIIKCVYVDGVPPQNDKILIQICGARKDGDTLKPANYCKSRGFNIGNEKALFNKTIFEFNHDFLSSIKLYEPKVIIAEIVEYLLGLGDSSLKINLGLSLNEEIINAKVSNVIRKVIESDDTEINDCYFSFSNEEYNDMLEQSEKNRYNILKGDNYVESNADDILSKLNNITSNSTLIEDKTIIKNTLDEIIATPAQDGSGSVTTGLNFDMTFELIRMFAYPLIRPLFTPKVIFLLLVNKKIMGSIDDIDDLDISSLINGLFFIIKDIIIKLKDVLIDLFTSWILEKLAPLLGLLASKLLMETLQNYRDLLQSILDNCMFNLQGSRVEGAIDDVRYADIIPQQTEPEQESIC